MQARRASREMALILFSQFNKNVKKYTQQDIEDIIIKSVRTLTDNITEELNITVTSLDEIKEEVLNYETDHENNLKRPIGTQNKPVPMVMTSDFLKKIDTLYSVAEKTFLALEIAEMATLEEKSEVKEYILEIAKEFQNHKKEIDEQIQKYSIGWDINRLIKIDKDILRIAITELLYLQKAPHKVVIDEAIELAKKYSTEDSSSFINGLLGKVVEANLIKK